MDGNIIALKKHLESIEELIAKFEEAQEKNEDQVIDIGRIESLARQVPFHGHFIKAYDEDIRAKYCTVLASYVRFADTNEKKAKQYYFISRIMQSDAANKMLAEIITLSEMVGIADFEMIKLEMKQDISLLVFDVLLMISLDGTIEESQMNYFCETLAYLAVEKKALQSILNACACVLGRGEEKCLFQYAADIPVAKLSCYLKKPIAEEVCTVLNDAKKSKEQYIIMACADVKNEEIDIDSYGKKNIRFINCRFENVASIIAKKTKVEFESCYFVDCKRVFDKSHDDEFKEEKIKEEDIANGAVFCFEEAVIDNCIFERCGQSFQKTSGGLLSCKKGTISNSVFKDCFVDVYYIWRKVYDSVDLYGYAAMLFLNKVSVTSCKFGLCRISGSGREEFYGRNDPKYQYLNLIYCHGGKIDESEFTNCDISGPFKFFTRKFNYVINGVGAMEKENQFINCNATDNVGSAKWGNIE